MKGKILNRTASRQHLCCTPYRFWWRRLGIGARWECDCGAVWEVARRFKFVAQAGNEVYRTEWEVAGLGSANVPGPLTRD